MSTPGAETNTFGEPQFENVAGASNSSVAATPTAPGHAAGELGTGDASFPAGG
jgi:hypothetical protein